MSYGKAKAKLLTGLSPLRVEESMSKHCRARTKVGKPSAKRWVVSSTSFVGRFKPSGVPDVFGT